MTSSSASSSSLMRRCQRDQLVLHALEVLGVGDQPLVDALLVALAPGLDLLDVGVGLALLAGQVVDLRSAASRPWSSSSARSAARARRAPAVSGQGAQLVPQQVDPGVELLDVEQLQLGERVGLQGVLLLVGVGARRAGQTRKVHGSVTMSLTRVSTVSPSAATAAPQLALDDRQPGPLRGPVRHVDQRRAAVLEELRGAVVPQVGGEVDVGAGAEPGRAGSPRPRRTATVSTTGPGPRRRGRRARSGQRGGDPRREVPQRHRRRQPADPAVPRSRCVPSAASSTTSYAGSS